MCKSIKFHQRWRYHCHKDTKECGGTDHAPSTERPKKLSFWNFSGTNPYFRTTLEQYSAVHFGSVSFFLAAFELIFSMLVLRHRPTQVKMVKSSTVPPHSSSCSPHFVWWFIAILVRQSLLIARHDFHICRRQNSRAMGEMYFTECHSQAMTLSFAILSSEL